VVPGSNGISVAKPIASVGGQGKVTSSRGGTYIQRQQSPPVVVRHVFTSSQGIPVTMAVLPQSQAPPEVSQPIFICCMHLSRILQNVVTDAGYKGKKTESLTKGLGKKCNATLI
jgi:hypothetical protein